MISAGRLNQQVSVNQPGDATQSPSGEITKPWVSVATAWAEVKSLHGRNVEIALARTKGRTVSHQITMRYIPTITIAPVTTQISFDGRSFELFSVVNVLERNIELDILASEIVS